MHPCHSSQHREGVRGIGHLVVYLSHQCIIYCITYRLCIYCIYCITCTLLLRICVAALVVSETRKFGLIKQVDKGKLTTVKTRENGFNIYSILLNDFDCWGGQTLSMHHRHLIHERPCIQSQASVAVVTMDSDMDTSLRDRLVRTRIPNNVGRGGQTASTSFNIRDDNERNVEWLLRQKRLNAFKLIQHQFKMGGKRFQH